MTARPLIEKIAEILCINCEGVSYDSLPESVKYLECRADGGRAIADKESARIIAEAIRAEIYAESKEPTKKMWAEGGNAAVCTSNTHHDNVSSAVWQAMLAASALAPEGGKE